MINAVKKYGYLAKDVVLNGFTLTKEQVCVIVKAHDYGVSCLCDEELSVLDGLMTELKWHLLG